MKIRNKILIYFSSTVITIVGISLIIIYILFSEYREESFQQQQYEKVKYTIGLIARFKQMSAELAVLLDEQDIHDFYDEKLLVYNDQKEMVFSSIDDLTIEKQNEILTRLSPSNSWIETKEDNYDLIGVYLENKGTSYYAISKAYDASGYSKLYFLKNVLIGIFITIIFAVILISVVLSNKITKPITTLAGNLSDIDLRGEKASTIKIDTSSYELQLLTERFNELLKRTNEAFVYQKHTIHHISHELKTPIAVLVSELEKISGYSDVDKMKMEIQGQVNNAQSIANIVNVLLEISKIESGQEPKEEILRIDELIFDMIDELNILYPDFNFEVNYYPDEISEDNLKLKVNKLLLKQAMTNLLTNCISYSDNEKGQIKIDCSLPGHLRIEIANTGQTITRDEEKHLFNRFFRGANSRHKMGFGLGLVLTQKIIHIHSGTIQYSNPTGNLNVFEVILPLS